MTLDRETSARGEASALASRWSAFQRRGAWFWLALALGAALRGWLALSTLGTADVELWTAHATGVAREGLVRHYASDPLFNHPPAIASAMASLWRLSEAIGIEFRVLYRSLVASIDLAAVFLIVAALRGSPWRWLAGAFHAVAPLAMILSGYHGNTDPMIGACALGCALLAGARRPIAAGVVFGVALWIKTPIVIAAPALVLAFDSWRSRAGFLAVAFAVGASTYATTFVEAARAAPSWSENVLVGRVFGYMGMAIGTHSDPPIFIWGLKNAFMRSWGTDVSAWPDWALWWELESSRVALAIACVFAWLRRRQRTTRAIAATIVGCYAIVYGVSEDIACHYFAWSLALWCCAGARFALSAHLVAGAYVWGLYAHACGDWMLRPRWDFLASAPWPQALAWARDFSQALFVAWAAIWLLGALLPRAPDRPDDRNR